MIGPHSPRVAARLHLMFALPPNPAMPRGLGLACVVALLLSLLRTGTAGASDALMLRPTERLSESLASPKGQNLPSFLNADHVDGQTDTQTRLEGNAVLRKKAITIRADQMVYDQASDTARASGRVRVNRAGNTYEGPYLELRLESFEGFFDSPRYQLLRAQANGQAERVEFLSEERSRIHRATYTTCKRDGTPDWMPDWMLSARTLEIDTGIDEGVAKGVVLSFKGVPILPVPYLSFPISNQRKSGLLPPSVGLDNVNGFEFTQPYYWNIAPNRDATITPSLMTERGVHLGSELRYLEANYSGSASLSLMPSDRLRDQNRWGFHAAHQGRLSSAWTDQGISLSVLLNRVSDDNYWRDFQSSTASIAPSLTQRLLDSQINLSWSNSGFSNSIRMQRWQTLQAPDTIVPPYDRLPQLHSRYQVNDWHGVDLAFDADLTRFQSDATLTQQPSGERLYALMQASLPWNAPYGYLTPKLQLHATKYKLNNLFNGADQAQRLVPTFGLDGALVFERQGNWLGQSMLQTMEPRFFLVSSAYRDQQNLPNYDSGANDFNMATIYQENQFVGHDRISDGSQLTLGLTSRFLDAQSGAEAIRLSLAQRVRFQDAKVFLPGSLPAEKGVSDLLLAASARPNTQWRFDATFQVSPNTQRTVRSNVVAHYKPGSFRALSVAYRFQRDNSELVDLAWQWPLLSGEENASAGAASADGKWYSVGRLNYSVKDQQVVDTLVGLEFDAGCWLGRFVVQRNRTGAASYSQNVMLQLEFVGFARLGINPLRSLRANIPNYESLRTLEPIPSRFSNYD